jgi:hypothetical protein
MKRDDILMFLRTTYLPAMGYVLCVTVPERQMKKMSTLCRQKS